MSRQQWIRNGLGVTSPLLALCGIQAYYHHHVVKWIRTKNESNVDDHFETAMHAPLIRIVSPLTPATITSPFTCTSMWYTSFQPLPYTLSSIIWKFGRFIEEKVYPVSIYQNIHKIRMVQLCPLFEYSFSTLKDITQKDQDQWQRLYDNKTGRVAITITGGFTPTAVSAITISSIISCPFSLLHFKKEENINEKTKEQEAVECQIGHWQIDKQRVLKCVSSDDKDSIQTILNTLHNEMKMKLEMVFERDEDQLDVWHCVTAFLDSPDEISTGAAKRSIKGQKSMVELLALGVSLDAMEKCVQWGWMVFEPTKTVLYTTPLDRLSAAHEIGKNSICILRPSVLFALTSLKNEQGVVYDRMMSRQVYAELHHYYKELSLENKEEREALEASRVAVQRNNILISEADKTAALAEMHLWHLKIVGKEKQARELATRMQEVYRETQRLKKEEETIVE